MADNLSPGNHSFKAASGRTLTYHVTPSTMPNAPLAVIQAVGWGVGRTLYVNGLASSFTSKFNVLCFSPRGSDSSSRPTTASGEDDPTAMGSLEMGDDLESLRLHLRISSFPVLMGHSNAGAISIGYAEFFPDNVEKLVLLDTQLLGFQTDSFQRFAAQRRDLPQYKKAYEAWSGPQPTTNEGFMEFLTNILPSYFVDPERDFGTFMNQLEGTDCQVWNYPSQSAVDAKEVEEQKQVSSLKAIKAKTLVLHGKDDMICGYEIAEKLATEIGDNAKLLVYENCGHLPWIERDDVFVKDVMEFISS